jgi:excisionase family DNA binding protein
MEANTQINTCIPLRTQLYLIFLIKRMDTIMKYFTITEAVAYLPIGRTWLYSKLNAGEIPAKKLGNKTLIAQDELDKWFDGKLDDYSMDIKERKIFNNGGRKKGS